jgi:hypothetical protein
MLKTIPKSAMLGSISWHGRVKPLHGDAAVGVRVKYAGGYLLAQAWKALCLADLQARLDNLIDCPDGSLYPG